MPKRVNKRSHQRIRKPIIIAGLAILLLTAGTGTYLYKRRQNNTVVPVMGATPSNSSNNKEVNLEPPTAADKTANEKHKNELVKDQSATPTNTNGKIKVTPTITYVNRTTVGAYIVGVFENGGTCTATLTQGSQTIVKTSTGFQNASYTQCAPISLVGANPGKGTWAVTVSYTSSSAEGQSGSQTIEL